MYFPFLSSCLCSCFFFCFYYSFCFLLRNQLIWITSHRTNPRLITPAEGGQQKQPGRKKNSYASREKIKCHMGARAGAIRELNASCSCSRTLFGGETLSLDGYLWTSGRHAVVQLDVRHSGRAQSEQKGDKWRRSGGEVAADMFCFGGGDEWASSGQCRSHWLMGREFPCAPVGTEDLQATRARHDRKDTRDETRQDIRSKILRHSAHCVLHHVHVYEVLCTRRAPCTS